MSDTFRSHGHRQVLAIDEDEELREDVDVAAAPRAWIRRHAPWIVVAAVLAALALVWAQTLVDARERARLAYLAGVPGILQPVPEHVAALWRWAPADATPLVADDTAGRWTIGTRYRRGAVELRGVDPDTGALLWTTPFPISDALPPEARDTFPSVWVRCATASAAPHPRAVCGADLAGPAQVVGTPLMVLNPTDGTVLARQVLPAGALWAVSAGRLVVATTIGDDDTHVHWDVRATDPSSGVLAWHRSTPTVPVSGPLRIGFTTIDSEATLTSDPGRVLLAGDGHAWLWSPDGTPAPAVTVGINGRTELGRSGTLAWVPFQSLSNPEGILITDRGAHVGVDGVQADLTVDDGSAHGVVLLRNGPGGNTLVARDGTTGTELWRAEGSTGPVLVLDGAVISADTSSVISRDARTGAQRWRTHLAATPVYLGADPLHVVVLTDDLELRTLDLAEGRTAAHADLQPMLPDAPTFVDAREHGGRLVVTFQDGSSLALG